MGTIVKRTLDKAGSPGDAMVFINFLMLPHMLWASNTSTQAHEPRRIVQFPAYTTSLAHEVGSIMQYSEKYTSILPDFFDSRERWPNCPSLKEIRDQGRCGSCWALATAQVMTDRVCIHSNGNENFHFSAEDILTRTKHTKGCGGGNPIHVWKRWAKIGYVSGGNYNSNEGCRPYSIANCSNHMKNCLLYEPTPLTRRSCRDGYHKSYCDDKKRGKPYYALQREKDIMADIYYRGPVVSIMRLYEDFEDYKRGVYQHRRGKFLASHVVKVIGWGKENGLKYWLCANSWGTDFGDNGFFKILRAPGDDIQFRTTAAVPILESM